MGEQKHKKQKEWDKYDTRLVPRWRKFIRFAARANIGSLKLTKIRFLAHRINLLHLGTSHVFSIRPPVTKVGFCDNLISTRACKSQSDDGETNHEDVKVPGNVGSGARRLPSEYKGNMLGHPRGSYDSSSSSETYVKIKVKKRSKTGMEHCLSEAIQANAKQLTDVMPFKDCELADEVVKSGCITEDECKTIRENKDRKKQVRALILLVKTRSFETMKHFLNAAYTQCPTVVDGIWEQYDKNINENRRSKHPCPSCYLKHSVDIHRICDDLWQANVIDDTLVREINLSTEVVGRQGQYWDAILDECCKNGAKGLPALFKALESDGHYTHIAKGLRYRFHQHEHLSCTCSISVLNVGCAKSRTSSLNSEATEMPGTSPSEDELTDVELGDDTDNRIQPHLNEEGKDSTDGSFNSGPSTSKPSDSPIDYVSRNTYEPPRQNIREKHRQNNKSWWRKLVFFCRPTQFTSIEEEIDS